MPKPAVAVEATMAAKIAKARAEHVERAGEAMALCRCGRARE